jgi:hypothetical protein
MCHRSVLPAQDILRFREQSGIRSFGLGLLVLMILLMPISYRAGTETSHAHTVFQGIVDAITGHPHHHSGDANAKLTESARLSPFVSVNVPLCSLVFDHTEAADAGAAGFHEAEDDGSTVPNAPDIPEQLGLSSPIESTSAIHELGSLIALLLAGAVRASLWGKVNRLFQVSITQDPPPPRHASC